MERKHTGAGLSFAACTASIARVWRDEGEIAARSWAADFQRNLGWDAKKLMEAAETVLRQALSSSQA